MKWYDFLTLGITWIIRMFKIGKAFYKLYKKADINKDKKVTAQELKELLKNKEAWNEALTEVYESFEYKRDEITKTFLFK